MKASEELRGTEQEFLKIFHEFCYCRMPWEVWSDIITAMACAIANSVDREPAKFKKRENEYENCIKRLGSMEKTANLLLIITMAFERNPNQNFLGQLYMTLGLGDHWKGQFFTPYSVCECMAGITIGKNIKSQTDRRDYISICDPACGAGATLIAGVNEMKRQHVNYQTKELVVGQDIDRVTGMMCYIQLSLLGCAGYVCIANTLTNPMVGDPLFPVEGKGQEYWYMPMLYTNVWTIRRTLEMMKRCGAATTKKAEEKEHFYMVFDFDKEADYGRDIENGN